MLTSAPISLSLSIALLRAVRRLGVRFAAFVVGASAAWQPAPRWPNRRVGSAVSPKPKARSGRPTTSAASGCPRNATRP